MAIILVAAMTFALCACGAKDEAKDSDGKTFTVGFDAEFPPYGSLDEATGEYVGFDLDLAEEVCKRNGWTLVKQPIDWDAKDMELSSGAIDCIWNGFTINGREDDYTFTVPYVDNSQVYVVKGDSSVKSEADMAGLTIGVQADSSALAALEDEDHAALKDSFKEIVQFADYNTGFMNLESGAIDILAMDIGVAKFEIASREEPFNIFEVNLATEQYGVGFLKGNDELKNEVEETLLQMAADGTVSAIAKKYEDFGLVDSVCIGK